MFNTNIYKLFVLLAKRKRITMDYNKVALHFMERMEHAPHKEPLNKMQRFSKGEMFAMNLLQKTEVPISAGDIATAMATSSARVANLLNTLENKGFIERCINTSDRRKILVIITKKGRQTIEKSKQLMQDHLSAVFKQMGEHDTIEFMRLTELFFNLMHTQPEDKK